MRVRPPGGDGAPRREPATRTRSSKNMQVQSTGKKREKALPTRARACEQGWGGSGGEGGRTGRLRRIARGDAAAARGAFGGARRGARPAVARRAAAPAALAAGAGGVPAGGADGRARARGGGGGGAGGAAGRALRREEPAALGRALGARVGVLRGAAGALGALAGLLGAQREVGAAQAACACLCRHPSGRAGAPSAAGGKRATWSRRLGQAEPGGINSVRGALRCWR